MISICNCSSSQNTSCCGFGCGCCHDCTCTCSCTCGCSKQNVIFIQRERRTVPNEWPRISLSTTNPEPIYAFIPEEYPPPRWYPRARVERSPRALAQYPHHRRHARRESRRIWTDEELAA